MSHLLRRAVSQSRRRSALKRRTHRQRGLLLESLELRALFAGDIAGTIYEDINNNGVKDGDDNGIPGWTVYVDLNRNAAFDAGEPEALTNKDGDYLLTGVSAGSKSVREILPPGWIPSTGTTDTLEVTVVNGKEAKLNDFFNHQAQLGTLEGTVWQDLNADGIRQEDGAGGFSDPGLQNWTLFLDVNRNNTQDTGEPSALTDAAGNFSFTDVPAGEYELFEVLPDGWEISPGYDVKETVFVANGAVTTSGGFGNVGTSNGSISGLIWNDVDGDGARSTDPFTGGFTDPGLAGWTVYIDLNRNNSLDGAEPTAITDFSGWYQFTDLQVGEYKLREVIPGGWEPAPTFDDNYSVKVYASSDSPAPDFANVNLSAPIPGTISGVIWNDLNSDGVRGLADDGLAGWTVYVDANANGTLDLGESQATSDATGAYLLTGVMPGTVTLAEVSMAGWRTTSPVGGTLGVTVRSGQDVIGQDFGNGRMTSGVLRGTVYNDADKNGVRGAAEKGLSGVVVYLDANNNGQLDAGEVQTTTAADQFYTPSIDEAGTYSFSHLDAGEFSVRIILPETLSATPAEQRVHTVSLALGEERSGIDTAAVYRPGEIHGVRFLDANGNHTRDDGEGGIVGTTVYVDLNRDDRYDSDEPTAITGSDGSYSFTSLASGFYVVREIEDKDHLQTYPQTSGGILWPAGTSNPASGNVSPGEIQASLTAGQSLRQTCSITLPNGGALTNSVDVFLLFDDTGSFVNNSPLVRAAFPTIMSQLLANLPGIDLGFGVGRLEEYANFAYEFDTGRPFILNQPIVAASTTGYQAAIQAALDRETPGYGGDQPETDIEALYQLVTGLGFDGNNNGSVLDSGPAGLASTQLNPGSSGDVPSFASFRADPAAGVLPAAGAVGGGGFRAGALPIVLLATDTGFAFQPYGETTVTGVNGLSLPVSSFSETSRATTPFNYGAGLQQTVTGLNALGALVIGLGTNPEANLDPRQGLEALSALTGAINRSAGTIDNGTTDPIAPGDPMYFQISSGFGGTVANGVVNAIQNAVTNVAVNVDVRASDPRVKIINHSGVKSNIGSGQTAAFDIEIVGDGTPRRFDLQFVRAGTNVVLGSIPVVLGTPVPGNGYEYTELEDGEIETDVHFGAAAITQNANTTPSFTAGPNVTVLEDSGALSQAAWATNISAGAAGESGQIVSFGVSVDQPSLFAVQPTISGDGTLTFTPALNANGIALVTVVARDDGGTAGGGVDSSAPQSFIITLTAVNDAPTAGSDVYSTSEDVELNIATAGVLGNDVDVDADSLSAVLVSGPTHGTLSFNADGSFRYTPNADFFGVDGFAYQASDGLAQSNVTAVSITVNAVNDAPLARIDTYTLLQGQALDVSAAGVLANDRDVEGDSLSANLVSGPAHGSLSLHADGSFLYTPDAAFFGVDGFTYQASDGNAGSDVVAVSLSVTAVNLAPIAQDDVYTTSEDSVLDIAAAGVLANDTDPDGDLLAAALLTGPQHGSLSLNADGSLRYTPSANYFGADSFSYRVSDGQLVSNTAVVSLNVTGVNDAPDAAGDNYFVNQNSVLTVSQNGVLANDTDVDGDTLTAILQSGPLHGSVSLGTGGGFVYTPVAGYSGADSFTYASSDGTAVSNPATVSIQVIATSTGGVKFYVVDSSADGTFGYDRTGRVTTVTKLNKENADARGIASNKTGTMQWTIDEKGDVFVYAASGKMLGTWTAKGVGKPEGITTDGVNVWIVDDDANRVHYFAGGASILSGKRAATSSFALNSANRNAMDLVTDGTSIWVVNDTTSQDRVFRYTKSGVLQGSWQIDAANASPTGIAIDPNDVNHIWTVDSKTDRVYQYDGATSLLSGSVSASTSFALAAKNTNPQGIADPLPHALHQHADEEAFDVDSLSDAIEFIAQDSAAQRERSSEVEDLFALLGSTLTKRREF